jgi:hypothetical protein
MSSLIASFCVSIKPEKNPSNKNEHEESSSKGSKDPRVGAGSPTAPSAKLDLGTCGLICFFGKSSPG